MTQPGDLPLSTRLDRIEDKLDQLLVDVTVLKVKAGLWGAFAGTLAAVAVAVITALVTG
jgi:hypothetical protein